METTAAQGVAVVVVPLPAHSHLNQLLHLSILLSQRGGVSVHYANSATHIRQARARIHGRTSDAIDNITFHEFPLPPFSAPPPDHNAPTRFPSHMMPSFEAIQHLQQPIAALLRSLSSASRRLVVIHERHTSFAGREADLLPNAEAYLYSCIPANSRLARIYQPSCHEGKEVQSVLRPLDVPDEFRDLAERSGADSALPSAGRLFNSCRPIEGAFIDLLAQHNRGQKMYVIGPLQPFAVSQSRAQRHECLEWLDSQPAASVVLVSFGTTTTLPDEQIRELAAALEGSGQRFIWVVRDADRGDMQDGGSSEKRMLPTAEYEKRVAATGLVVRGWAPQLEILGHPSTGAFVSHCGWNSCMESMGNGVPILAWPMHSDQPRNALLVTEYLKAGVGIGEWARRAETVPAAEIDGAIRRVMVGGEGEEIRKRAKDLREQIHRAVGDGGSSHAQLSSFMSHIVR